MKQRVLTEEQRELLGRMERLFQEAKDKNIGFVYDVDDGSLTAFNTENVSDFYTGRMAEDESDRVIDWGDCSIIENASIDYTYSATKDYYLKFE